MGSISPKQGVNITEISTKTTLSFDSVSKSAFSQARRNLKPETFIELSQKALTNFRDKAPYPKTWKKKRVIGIDGSLLNLPTSEELRKKFGFIKNQYEEIISARCSFAYNVCNELVLDAKIDKRKSCEKELAYRHLQALDSDNDILVFDRGYPCQWLVGILLQQDFKFCFRLSTAWKSAYASLNNVKRDIEWTMVHRSHKGMDKLKMLGIPMQIEGLRLVMIDLPSGEKEVLLTNLTNKSEFTYEDLKKLYHLRWGVEEAFKSFKKVLHIECFTGKSILAIQQDFYAKVFLLNIASMIRGQAVNPVLPKGGKYKYQAIKTQALAKIKDYIVDLLGRFKIRSYLDQMIDILIKRTEIIRPNRSVPRIDISARRRLKGLNSKGI